MDEDAYYDALKIMGERYKKMIAPIIDDTRYWGETYTGMPLDELITFNKFMSDFINGCDDRLPLCKLNRWLGYIQGMIIANDLTTVEMERDFSRPLFRPLDYPE